MARSNVPRPPKAKMTPTASLPPCTLKYALAIADPLSPAARGACVPYGSNASQKVAAIIRFDTVFNAAGVIAILAAPCTANDLPSVYYTTAGYPHGSATDLFPWASGGSHAAPATHAAGWATAKHNGPYPSNQLICKGIAPAGSLPFPEVSSRIVSAGYRIQYTGTTLNESGMYTCLQDPAHRCLSGQDVGSLQTSADTLVEATSRNPCMLRMHGIFEHEMGFSELEPNPSVVGLVNDVQTRNLYPFSSTNLWRTDNTSADATAIYLSSSGAANTGATIAGAPSGVILAIGKAGESVHVEVTIHLEYVGQAPSLLYTPVSADPMGAQLVRTAALTIPAKMQSNPKGDAWGAILSGIKAGWHELKPILIPAAKAAAEVAILTAMA